jgi:hypothetical protein
VVGQGNGTASFINAGIVRKSAGTGPTSFGLPFFNTGTLEVQTGLVQLSQLGASTGSFSIAADAQLAIIGAGYRLDAGASVTGAGTLRTVAPLEIAAPISIPNLILPFSGTVTGAGALTITGTLTWSAAR